MNLPHLHLRYLVQSPGTGDIVYLSVQLWPASKTGKQMASLGLMHCSVMKSKFSEPKQLGVCIEPLTHFIYFVQSSGMPVKSSSCEQGLSGLAVLTSTVVGFGVVVSTGVGFCVVVINSATGFGVGLVVVLTSPL